MAGARTAATPSATRPARRPTPVTSAAVAAGDRRAEGGEEPRPHAHGRRHLGHPEHVQEPGRASEVGDEEDAAHADRGRRRQQAPAGEAGVAREPSAGGEEGRPGRDPAGEEVGRDVPLPHRPLEDGPPVVRPHRRGSGHRRRRPRKAAAAPSGEGCGGGGGRAPHPGEVAGGDHRVGGQAVDLGVVEEEEEGAHAADAVGRVGAVEAGLGHARRLQRRRPEPRPGPAARPAGRTGSTWWGRRWRTPAPVRPAAGRSTWCTSRPGRRPCAGRSPRTGRRGCSSRSRCRCPPAPPPCRTRCAPATRWGTPPGRRPTCSACTRRSSSATGIPLPGPDRPPPASAR